MHKNLNKENVLWMINGKCDFCCNDAPKLKSFGSGQNDNPELYQYYYHSDHLGSTSLITNLDGETVQHVKYVPFREVFIEERNNTWNTPYFFNAKEFIEMHGLNYYDFHKRFYDPLLASFLTMDPLCEKYYSESPYAYALNNPIRNIDLRGDSAWSVVRIGMRKIIKHMELLYKRNWQNMLPIIKK